MYLEFVLHGAKEPMASEARNRSIVVELNDDWENREKEFVNHVFGSQVGQDIELVKTHIQPLPEDRVTVPKERGAPNIAIVAILKETRDFGKFRSTVNPNKSDSFMTYRLAKHITEVFETRKELQSEEAKAPAPKETEAMEELKSALDGLNQRKNLPVALQQQLQSLSQSTENGIKDASIARTAADLKRAQQHLRAAVEFGARDGDLTFFDRSVDLELDPRSVLCDTSGEPLPLFKDRIREIMAHHFPHADGKTIDIQDRFKHSGPEKETRHSGPAVRVLFTASDEMRMQRALKVVLEELTIEDEPSVMIRGQGHAAQNSRILATQKMDTDPSVKFAKQIPQILSKRLHDDSNTHTMLRSYDRRNEDLYIEAKAFITEHSEKYEAQYQQWRAKVDPLFEKTKSLSSDPSL